MNSFKKILIFILFLAVTLVSCKTNETKKNTKKTSEKNHLDEKWWSNGN